MSLVIQASLLIASFLLSYSCTHTRIGPRSITLNSTVGNILLGNILSKTLGKTLCIPQKSIVKRSSLVSSSAIIRTRSITLILTSSIKIVFNPSQNPP